MARGESLGQRRKRRRARRNTGPPLPDHSSEARPDPAEAKLLRELADRPDWVRRLWATPVSRVGVSLVFLGVAVWIFWAAATNRRHGGPVGFASAALLVPAFGAQLVEAVGDLARGTNAAVPVFHRIGRWADGHLLLLGVYAVAAVAVWLVVVL